MKVLVDYLGREVRLTHERLAHILEHPEMEGLEPVLAAAIQRPEVVIESQTDASVSLYYFLLKETRVGVKWLCVVVKHLESDAFVLTAYLTDNPKRGKKQWPES